MVEGVRQGERPLRFPFLGKEAKEPSPCFHGQERRHPFFNSRQIFHNRSGVDGCQSPDNQSECDRCGAKALRAGTRPHKRADGQNVFR